MGDFGAMQKALHSAAKYKAMLKTKVKAVIGGTDYNNADSGFVKKALSDKSSAEELLGKTSVEVNIIEESSCMNPATAVKDIDDTVIIVGKITQFRSKPSNQQVLASFNDPASPFKHLNLEFKYGGHRVIQGLELAVRGMCFNQSRIVIIPPALMEELPAEELPAEQKLHLRTDSWTAMGITQTFHSYLYASEKMKPFRVANPLINVAIKKHMHAVNPGVTAEADPDPHRSGPFGGSTKIPFDSSVGDKEDDDDDKYD